MAYEAHQMRITSGGKISSYVTFALDFFQKNKNTALVLHTLPTSIPIETSSKTRLSTCTTNTPRLISVVEIIKREYLKTLDAGQVQGLHQYNEIGSLEGESVGRGLELAQALEGKHHVKEKQTVYMKITLCVAEMTEMASREATYQLSKRRLSKSAKSRARKRQKRKIT